MRRQTISMLLYILGGVILLSVLIIGPYLDNPMKAQGLNQFMQTQPAREKISFFVFALAFPVGILMCAIAGLVATDSRLRQLISVIVTLGVLVAIVIVWPVVAGRQHSPLYFGAGGSLLLILIFAVTWYWHKLRVQAAAGQRRIVDLRGLAYFCFALATWNSCGAGGLPGYALYPEAVQSTQILPFLVGQYKVIMFYFVAGWLMLLLSMVWQLRQRH